MTDSELFLKTVINHPGCTYRQLARYMEIDYDKNFNKRANRLYKNNIDHVIKKENHYGLITIFPRSKPAYKLRNPPLMGKPPKIAAREVLDSSWFRRAKRLNKRPKGIHTRSWEDVENVLLKVEQKGLDSLGVGQEFFFWRSILDQYDKNS